MYKNYTKKLGMPKRHVHKLLLIMRLTTVLLIATMMQVSAAGFAQRVTLVHKKISLEKMFWEIHKQTGYDFLFDRQLMNKKKVIDIDMNNKSIEEVLQYCLPNQSLDYKIKDHTIVIREQEKSVVEETLTSIRKMFQQDTVVYKGIVVNDKNLRMAGATITFKGDKKMVVTNGDGSFVIRGPREGVLVVKYIGFTTQEVKVNVNNLNMAISMLPATTDLMELQIVSTGYQDVPKERATGSFEVITAKQLQHSSDPNLLKRLEGITTSMNFNNQMTMTNSSAVTRGLNSQFDNSPLKNLTIRGKTTLTANASYDASTQHGIPLVVIDGVASPYSIDMVNPDDVESITILKDAAANSIWGSRAANGVIVIKTKKANYNTPVKVSFNSNLNISDKIDLFYKDKMSVSDFVDAQQYAFSQIYEGEYDPSNTSTYIPDPSVLVQDGTAVSPVFEILNAQKMERITAAEVTAQLGVLKNNDIRRDYTKYLMRSAVNQSYSLNLSGGTQKVKYNLSGGYTKSLNNTVNSDNDRINLNYSMSMTPVKNLDLSAGILYGVSHNNDQGSRLAVTGITDSNFYPYSSLADNQGSPSEINRLYYRPSFINLLESTYGNNILSYRYSPLEDMNESYNKLKIHTININLGARYQIKPWVSANVTYNYSHGSTNQSEYYSQNSYYMRELINRYTTNALAFTNTGAQIPAFTRQIPLGGMWLPAQQTSDAHTVRGTLDMNKTWNEKHELNAIAGVDVSSNYAISRQDQYYGYDSKLLTNNNLLDYVNQKSFLFQDANYQTSGLIPFLSGVMADSKVHTVGIYSNVAYSYDKRYTISASLRKDASSEFGIGTNKRGTPFYSFGTAWNIDNEKFYHIDWLNMLKLRATYGYNGNVNSEVTASPYLTVSPGTGSISNTTGLQSFANATGIENRNLRPEKTGMLNVGLDFAMLRNRISGSVEYYNKKTTDLIAYAPVDPSIGYTTAMINTANLKGEGVDLTLNTVNVRAGKFSWTSNFLFSYNTVKVTKLYVSSVQNQRTIVASDASYNIGYDLNRIFAYKWGGLDPVTGDPRGYINGEVVTIGSGRNGAIAYNTLGEQAFTEARYFGSAVPVYFGSFRHTLNYGSFAVSASLLYKMGYYFRRSTADVVNYGNLFGTANTLQSAEYYNRWQNPGDELITNVPSLAYTSGDDGRNQFYRLSEVNVLKADHIRLQEVNFSYGIKTKKTFFLKDPRVYANVTNLGIVWRANKLGLDPDVNDYPNPRTYSFGFSANF